MRGQLSLYTSAVLFMRRVWGTSVVRFMRGPTFHAVGETSCELQGRVLQALAIFLVYAYGALHAQDAPVPQYVDVGYATPHVFTQTNCPNGHAY